MQTSNPELVARLNQETGQLSWREMQRHFARGSVIKVAAELDLLDVAVAMANDDKAAFTPWLENGQVGRAGTEDALDWSLREPDFWAVVVAPWLLVQEIGRGPR